MSIIAIATLSGCVSQYYILDTTSSSVYEYKNDFYVSKIDTVIEMHYEFWSQNAALWLSVYNNMQEPIFLIRDSAYLEYNGKKVMFDHLVDWPEYSKQLAITPGLDDYDLSRVLPILPNRWKGMLSPGVSVDVDQWENYPANTVFTQEDTPWKVCVQTCFYQRSYAITPICQRDTIWVQTFAPTDPQSLRNLELNTSYLKSDKFYITNSLNWN